MGHGIPDFAEASRILDPHAFEQKYDAWLTVYPNPLTDRSVVEFFSDDSYSASLRVFDVMGRQVYAENNIPVSEGFNSLPLAIYLQHQRSGLFIIRLEFGGNSRVIKALKDR